VRKVLFWGAIVLTVIGMLPFLFMTGLQIWAAISLPREHAAWLASRNEQVAAGEPAPQPVAAPDPDPAQRRITPEGDRVDSGLRATLDAPVGFTKHRRVSVLYRVLPGELAVPGEIVPDGVLGEVFIETRAQRLSEDGCAAVTASVGAACIVDTVGVVPPRPDEGQENARHEIAFDLLFTPADMPGAAVAGPVVVVEEHQIKLYDATIGTGGLIEQKAELDRALADARGWCDQLRTEIGNCMVHRVRLTALGGAPARMRAEATMLVQRPAGPEEVPTE